jgi:hypothetical protein
MAAQKNIIILLSMTLIFRLTGSFIYDLQISKNIKESTANG